MNKIFKENILPLAMLMFFIGVLFIAGWLINLKVVAPANNPYGLSNEAIAYLSAKLKQKRENPKRYDQPGEAQEFYVFKHAPQKQTNIPVEQYGVALQEMEQMPQYSTKLDAFLPSCQAIKQSKNFDAQAIGPWESLGPGPH